MTHPAFAPFIALVDDDLEAVLGGRARATAELINRLDALIASNFDAPDDLISGLALVAAVQLASIAPDEWGAVQRLAQDESLATDVIADRVAAGFSGDQVAASAAEALALLLLHGVPGDVRRDLPPTIAYLLGSALLVGERTRPLRKLPWAQQTHRLLVTQPLGDREFSPDDMWIQLAHLLVDVIVASAQGSAGHRLYAEAESVLNEVESVADSLGAGAAHRRRLGRLCLQWVRNGGPPARLKVGIAAALDGSSMTSGVEAIDFRDLAARSHSLRAEIDGAEEDRRAAIDLWSTAAAAAAEVGDRRIGARVRVNWASELGLLAKMTNDQALVWQSIQLYEEASTYADSEEERSQIASGRSNRYRQLYDMTSERDHLDRSISLGESAIAGLSDDAARSTALNNQATRFRRRFEDFGSEEDLDEAIALSDRAVDLIPVGRRERSRWLATLAQNLRLRAELYGNREDIVRARWNARRALRAEGTPGGDAALDALVSTELLDPSITLVRLDRLAAWAQTSANRDGSPSQVAFRRANLAHVLARRFELSGDPVDAQHAADAWDDALRTSPHDHVDHVGMLTQAGAGAELMYESTGEAGWLLLAIERHREALARAQDRGLAGPVVAVISVNLANALARHGELTLSVEELDQAIAAAKQATALAGAAQREAALTALGGALLSRHEHEADQRGRTDANNAYGAIASYRAAYEAARSDRGRTAAAGNLANALFHVGYTTGDLELLNESTDWYVRSTTDVEPGDVAGAIRLTNLGFTALTVAGSETDEEVRARQLRVAVDAFEDARHAQGPLVELRVALGKARVYAATSSWTEAADSAVAAVELFKSAAPAFVGGRYAQGLMRLAGPLAPLGALALVRLGEPETAIEHLESARATLLHADLLTGSVLAANLRAAGDVSGADELTALLARMRELDAQVSNSSSTALGELGGLRDRVAPLIASAKASLGISPPHHVSPAHELAAERAMPVVYLVGDDHGGAILVAQPDGTTHVEELDALRTGVAGRAATRLRRTMIELGSLASQHHLRTELDNLCRRLGGMVGERLIALASATGGRLTIVPVGALAGIPWHALEVDGLPLASVIEISYQPTATLGLASHGRPKREPVRGTVVSYVPPDGLDWGMPAEARSVADAWREHGLDVAELFGSDARSIDIASTMAHSDLTHVAAHALERPLASESGIVVADGLMSARSLLASGTSSQLVYFAACSTGRTALDEDEEFTLAAAALTAGARTVVSTLWPIPDAVGDDVAQRFYDGWFNGLRAAEALRSAQLDVRERFNEEAFFWAGFAVSGAS